MKTPHSPGSVTLEVDGPDVARRAKEMNSELVQGTPARTKTTLLIIDDDSWNLELVSECLHGTSCDIFVAQDTHTGLARALQLQPDLILMDVVMPGMDGFEACRKLKEQEATRDIPVIFMTALSDADNKVKGFAAGAVDYVTKPFNQDEVLARVGVHLRLRDLARSQQDAKDDLERRVQERTSELARANVELRSQIAERIASLLELQRSKDYLHKIIDTVADPLFVKDRQRRWVLVNQAFCNFIGHSRDEMIGRTASDFFPPTQAGAFDEKDDLVFENGRENVSEGELTDARGVHHTIVTKKTLYADERGGRFLVGIIRDHTERKHLEAQLRQAQKMEAIGTLAGGIAHDFNNILTGILGFSSLLKARLDATNPLKRCADEIVLAAERAAKLTHDLLAFSRKQPIKPRPINLNDIVRGIEQLLRRVIGEDVKLNVRLADEDLTILADSGQIEQVLMNLSTNSRDAMPDGGVLTIATEKLVTASGTSVLPPGDYATLIISDSGTGMDEETRQRVFEPFFTTKGAGKGTGLGLSIVYGIVKQHGGEISVYSEPGSGTTVKIYLKRTGQEHEHASAPPVPQCPLVGTETILVAEDDAGVRRFLEHVLSSAGYSVILATDGEDAVEQFRAHRDSIQMVLLDVVMPKKNGKEAYEEMRLLAKDLRVLFSSGYTADIINRRGIVDEALNFISKPVSAEDLLAKVREILSRSA